MRGTSILSLRLPLNVGSPLLGAVTVAGFLLIWELLGRTRVLLPILFPSWAGILLRFWEQLVSGEVVPHLLVTLYEVLLGTAGAAAVAIPAGLILGRRRALRRLLEPLVLCISVVPTIILLPLSVWVLGIGADSKLALSALTAALPICLATIASIREIRPVYLNVARSFKARPWQLWTRVYLPAIQGHLMVGVRLGLGAAFVTALLAETKIARAGLGVLLIEHYTQFELAEMYAVILLVFLVGLALDRALARLVPSPPSA